MQGHVVIAPDKFKGSLTAAQVAAHVATGLRPLLERLAEHIGRTLTPEPTR